MDLAEVIDRLHKYACPSLAASWDNVGLLVEPSSPHIVSRLLLTNDLTSEVVDEAVECKANMILSYHPPIFQPFKKLTQKTWKEKLIVKCIENKIAIYSPHTSYDVLREGINDWLVSPFGGLPEPIIMSFDSKTSVNGDYSVALNLYNGIPDGIEAKLNAAIPGATLRGLTSLCDANAVRLRLTCSKNSLTEVVSFFEKSVSDQTALEIVELVKPPLPGYGYGRIVSLGKQLSIDDAVQLVKSHLKLQHVRLALGSDKTTKSLIGSVAVCAGSGSSVLRGIKADLYLTGEMSHHDVLDAVQSGVTVILCDHSNTERGFLNVLQQTLDLIFNHEINIQISLRDRDPLEIV